MYANCRHRCQDFAQEPTQCIAHWIAQREDHKVKGKDPIVFMLKT
jgi:hypothetical protein